MHCSQQGADLPESRDLQRRCVISSCFDSRRVHLCFARSKLCVLHPSLIEEAWIWLEEGEEDVVTWNAMFSISPASKPWPTEKVFGREVQTRQAVVQTYLDLNNHRKTHREVKHSEAKLV